MYTIFHKISSNQTSNGEEGTFNMVVKVGLTRTSTCTGDKKRKLQIIIHYLFGNIIINY